MAGDAAPRAEDEMWAWVTRLPDGRISFVGVLTRLGHMPLVHHEREVIERMRPLAEHHARETGQRVWLRRYVRDGLFDGGQG